MAKLKLDVAKAKEFAKQRAERVALGGAAALAVVCFFWGVSSFFAASSPDAAIRKDAERLEGARNAAEPPPKEARVAATPPSKWLPVKTADAKLTMDVALFEPGAAGDNRRFSPPILGVDADPKSFQLDYLNTGVYLYDVNETRETFKVFKAGEGVNSDGVFLVGQKRMVVVSATFPYYEQCVKHAKALRFENVAELFPRGLAPTYEGLNVERRKISGFAGKEKVGDWENVYRYDPAADKMEVSKGVANLLQTCIYEDTQIEKYSDLMHGSAITPLPYLAGTNTEYPDLKIPSLEKRLAPPIDPKMKDGFNPGVGGGKRGAPIGRTRNRMYPVPSAQERQVQDLAYKSLPQDVMDQVTGKINWFSPYGTFPDEAPKTGEEPGPIGGTPKGPPGKLPGRDKGPGSQGPAPGQMPGPGPGFGGGMDQFASNLKAPDALPPSPKSLVRFVDVDVDPGAKYQYRIQVRFANPNYKMPSKLVAHTGLTRIKELVSDWVETPPITIPQEIQYYIVHQEKNFATKLKGKDTVDIGAAEFNPSKLADRVPFQVHRYVGVFQDTKDKIERYVCDWVIAERLLVGRGEAIGREAEVELVVWNKTRAAYELGSRSIGVKQPKGGAKGPTGIPVDFRTDPQVVLLDFSGGKHTYKYPKSSELYAEESAVEALLLMPDGSLTLRNSRNDMSDAGFESKEESGAGGHTYGQERRKRWEEWRKRLEDVRTPPKASGM